MPRYIDADKMRDDWLNNGENEYVYNTNAVLDSIDAQPTADVVEVKHGKWKKSWCDNNLIGHEYEECSVCGCSMLDTNQFWNSNYCPNCGAKMDGKDDEK